MTADPALRQRASLEQSAGWLLNALQQEADIPVLDETALADRLDRIAHASCWDEGIGPRLKAFADRFRSLMQQPAGDDSGRSYEAAASEALALYVESQGRAAAQRAELSRSLPAEDDQAGRLRHLAEIGASVRAILDADPRARKLGADGLEIYEIPSFVTAEESAGLIALIDRDCYPSGVLGDDSDKEFRTSRSCDLQVNEPLVDRIDRRLADLLGIDRRFSERIQGQRYEVGQQFKPHHDFFHEGEGYYDYAQRQGGQRSWTAMLFLDGPEAGGCTNFPQAGVKVTPEPGKLLLWNNMKPDGSPNPQSLHQGMPVEAGVKYVITKWFRERPWG